MCGLKSNLSLCMKSSIFCTWHCISSQSDTLDMSVDPIRFKFFNKTHVIHLPTIIEWSNKLLSRSLVIFTKHYFVLLLLNFLYVIFQNTHTHQNTSSLFLKIFHLLNYFLFIFVILGPIYYITHWLIHAYIYIYEDQHRLKFVFNVLFYFYFFESK